MGKSWTPLRYATHQGNLEAVCILMKHGADWMMKDSEDCYPWMEACGMGRNDIAHETLKGIDLNQKLSNG